MESLALVGLNAIQVTYELFRKKESGEPHGLQSRDILTNVLSEPGHFRSNKWNLENIIMKNT